MQDELELWSDSHNVNSIGLHLVWCPKYRKPLLQHGIDVVVKDTIKRVCEENRWGLIRQEVMPDHIHVFVQIHASDRPTDVVRVLKSKTAVAVYEFRPRLASVWYWRRGIWSRGAYYGSVGAVSQETVIHYIENQKEEI